MDLIWYNSLVKPVFVPSSGYFTLLLAIVYVLQIAVFARLVIGKHFFPSVFILLAVEVFSALFVYAFFSRCNVYLGMVFIIFVFVLSFIQQVRFFIKELRIAVYYLPIFIFNCYCLVTVCVIAFAN